MKNLFFTSILLVSPVVFAIQPTTSVKATTQKTMTFTVKGMSCQDCANNVTKALMNVPGVEKVAVDHVTGKTEITLKSKATVDEKALKSAIEGAGFTVQG